MDIYLGAAEQPKYLRDLVKLGVTHVAISYFEWQRRHSSDDLYKHVPEELSVCVMAGVSRKDGIDFRLFSKDYIEFAERNHENALIFDMDSDMCPPGIRRATRHQLDMIPNTVMFPMADEELRDLAGQYERIGLNARTTKSVPTQELRRLRATLYGSNVADQQVLRNARFEATTTLSWLGGRRYGELWVYSRGKMHHYTAENLAKAVRGHREDLIDLDVDPDACLANDKEALTRAAVKSLQAMALALSQRPRDRVAGEIADLSANDPPSQPTVKPSDGSATPSQKMMVEPFVREHITLPVFMVKQQADKPMLESAAPTLMRCSSCYLSEVCPEFHDGAECAFDLPVEIRTPAQRRAASEVMVEWQFKRVAMGVFGEQIDGQGIGTRVGQEMDRYHKMLLDIKELEQDSQPPPGSGPLSSIFGPPPELGAMRAPDPTEEDSDEEDNGYEDAEEVEPAIGVGATYDEEGRAADRREEDDHEDRETENAT